VAPDGITSTDTIFATFDTTEKPNQYWLAPELTWILMLPATGAGALVATGAGALVATGAEVAAFTGVFAVGAEVPTFAVGAEVAAFAVGAEVAALVAGAAVGEAVAPDEEEEEADAHWQFQSV